MQNVAHNSKGTLPVKVLGGDFLTKIEKASPSLNILRNFARPLKTNRPSNEVIKGYILKLR
jgi:hypothetical protein